MALRKKREKRKMTGGDKDLPLIEMCLFLNWVILKNIEKYSSKC